MGAGIDSITGSITSMIGTMTMTIFTVLGILILIAGFFSVVSASQSGEGSEGAFTKIFVGLLVATGPSLVSSMFSEPDSDNTEVTQTVNTVTQAPIKEAVQHVSVTYKQAAPPEPFDWSIFIPVLKFIGYGVSIAAILCVIYFSIALFISFINVKKSLKYIGLEENFLMITKNKEHIEKQIKKNSRKLFKLPDFMNKKILKINEMLEDKNRKYQAVIDKYKEDIIGS